jgi:hypothetical protein
MKEGDDIIVMGGTCNELLTKVDHIEGNLIWFKDEEGRLWYEDEECIELTHLG